MIKLSVKRVEMMFKNIKILVLKRILLDDWVNILQESCFYLYFFNSNNFLLNALVTLKIKSVAHLKNLCTHILK